MIKTWQAIVLSLLVYLIVVFIAISLLKNDPKAQQMYVENFENK